MLRPDGSLIGLHLLGGGHGNVRAARHHPRADADTLGEDNGALGSALPQRAGEVAVGQRQDIGQRNDIGGVAMVDHTVGTVGGRLADAVVHEVARELRGRAGTLGQTPDNAPAVALVVDLHDADAVDGIGSTLRKNLPEPVVMKYSPARLSA